MNYTDVSQSEVRRTVPEIRKGQSASDTSSSSGRAVTVHVSACYSARLFLDRNPVRQLLVPEGPISVALSNDGSIKVPGSNRGKFSVVRSTRHAAKNFPSLLLPRSVELQDGRDLRDEASVRWVGEREVLKPDVVLSSFHGAFNYVEEDPAAGKPGLRAPQAGAVHAVLGYWTTDPSQPATVVMPTGTGKTEAMLALFVAARPPRLLVIVPSDALREQL